MHEALRQTLDELRARCEQHGYSYSERNVYNGRGLTIHVRQQRATSLDRTLANEDVLDDLRRTLVRVRREAGSKVSIDPGTGLYRVRLTDVHAQMSGVTAKVLGALCRHVGLNVFSGSGRMWILCDRSWSNFIPISMRGPEREPVR